MRRAGDTSRGARAERSGAMLVAQEARDATSQRATLFLRATKSHCGAERRLVRSPSCEVKQHSGLHAPRRLQAKRAKEFAYRGSNGEGRTVHVDIGQRRR